MANLAYNKLIDPLNYFDEIKNICKKFKCVDKIYAIGSRVSGKSTKGKWDFDILILRNKDYCENIRKTVNDNFEFKKDEFDQKVRIDMFIIPEEHFNKFLNTVNFKEL